MAPLFAPRARRRCEEMAHPLASNGNEAIGAKSKPDTSDAPVAVHEAPAGACAGDKGGQG